VTTPPGELRKVVRARRWLRRAGIAVAVMLTLIAGGTIMNSAPDQNAFLAPYYFTGRAGEPVHLGELDVTLLKVRGAAKVDPADVLPATTDGVWIIAEIRLEATTKTAHAAYAALAASDTRTFRASGRFRQSLIDGTMGLVPGIPVRGEVVFEVPKGVTGLTLRIGTNDINPDLQPYTDIPLPIRDADLVTWAADQRPATIEDTKVGE
jgi:hypothetical protein